MLDPIAEMLTNIRNAVMANHRELVIPRSKFKKHLADLLVTEGYIVGVEEIKDGPQGRLKLTLKIENEESPIHEITMISTPGQRIYVKKSEIYRVKNGLGMSVISTSQGLMTDSEARKRKLGGEVICRVW